MATFYVGARPVLAGVDTDNFTHSWTHGKGTYSNWSLMNTGSKVLSGAPDHEYVLGNNTQKQARILEYIYAGKPHVAPMANPGLGSRMDGGRFRPNEYKGLASSKAL